MEQQRGLLRGKFVITAQSDGEEGLVDSSFLSASSDCTLGFPQAAMLLSVTVSRTRKLNKAIAVWTAITDPQGKLLPWLSLCLFIFHLFHLENGKASQVFNGLVRKCKA